MLHVVLNILFVFYTWRKLTNLDNTENIITITSTHTVSNDSNIISTKIEKFLIHKTSVAVRQSTNDGNSFCELVTGKYALDSVLDNRNNKDVHNNKIHIMCSTVHKTYDVTTATAEKQCICG